MLVYNKPFNQKMECLYKLNIFPFFRYIQRPGLSVEKKKISHSFLGMLYTETYSILEK